MLSGDWAARLRLGTPAPYRLELIVDRDDLDSLAGSHDVSELGEQPGRYGLHTDGVEVNLLLANEAHLGERLRLPTAVLAEHAEDQGGHRALSAEGIFASRMASLLDRPDSKLAERDRLDLWSLAAQPEGLAWTRLASLLRQTDHPMAEQKLLLQETFGRLAELEELGRHRQNRIWGWQRQALEAVDLAATAAAAEARLEELADKQREGTMTGEERRQQRVLYYRLHRQDQPEPPMYPDPPLPGPDSEPER